MNYLAHLLLSGSNEQHMLGNYIADAVKGSSVQNYHPDIQYGIQMHRAIDTYTDSHPLVEQSKSRLREGYRKYAPVIVDVFYDHFLAANWLSYASVPLNTYARNVYKLLQQNRMLLPEKSQQFLEYMIYHDILNGYADINAVHRVLVGMSHRSAFESNMDKSVKELKAYYGEFKTEFEQFFPLLREHIQLKFNVLT